MLCFVAMSIGMGGVGAVVVVRWICRGAAGEQVHFPFPYLGGMDAMAEGLARACERGLCRSVGVSNFNAEQVRHTDGAREGDWKKK